MLKKILVVAGGVALAVSLPLVALAATTNRTPALSSDTYGATATLDADDQPMVQEMTQQRLRVHAETGPPEDFEPIQQRLHQHEQQQLGDQNQMMGGNGFGQGMHGHGDMEAPMNGDGTGECTHEDGPMGGGPHGGQGKQAKG